MILAVTPWPTRCPQCIHGHGPIIPLWLFFMANISGGQRQMVACTVNQGDRHQSQHNSDPNLDDLGTKRVGRRGLHSGWWNEACACRVRIVVQVCDAVTQRTGEQCYRLQPSSIAQNTSPEWSCPFGRTARPLHNRAPSLPSAIPPIGVRLAQFDRSGCRQSGHLPVSPHCRCGCTRISITFGFVSVNSPRQTERKLLRD